MGQKAPYRLDSPGGEVSLAARTAIRNMHRWREVLKPLLDEAFEELIDDGILSASMAESLNDFGEYWQSKSKSIFEERERLGMGRSTKPVRRDG